MFKELNPLLHSELRLAVMSLLISVEEADFVYIRQQTGATAGNLSVQIDKLNKAGYVGIYSNLKTINYYINNYIVSVQLPLEIIHFII